MSNEEHECSRDCVREAFFRLFLATDWRPWRLFLHRPRRLWETPTRSLTFVDQCELYSHLYNNAFDLGAPQTSVSAPLIWWWWDPRGIRMPRRSPCSAVWERAVSVLMWILVEMMSQSSAREPAMETLGHCILFDQRQTTMNGIPTVQRSKNYVWCMCDCRFIFNLVCEVSADRA